MMKNMTTGVIVFSVMDFRIFEFGQVCMLSQVMSCKMETGNAFQDLCTVLDELIITD